MHFSRRMQFKTIFSNTYLILLGIIVLNQKNIKANDFFSNFEEVSPPSTENIGAIPKCGEGDQNGKFICVPYYNCEPLSNTVMNYSEVDGSNEVQPRLEIVDAQCGHYLEVCCPVVNNSIGSTQHVSYVEPKFEAQCGIKNEGNDTDQAAFAEFPWAIALMETSARKSNPFCGGSLLNPVVVLTAAHCVARFKPNQIKVRAGEWDFKTISGNIPYQERNVVEIITHEHYWKSTLYNDVALLLLNRSLTKANNVGTVCLPENINNIDTKNCYVTGWGKKLENRNDYSNILKKLQVSVVPYTDCQKELKIQLGKEFILHRSFTCAHGYSDNHTCMGDGGSPLVCPDSSNRHFQVGIASWGLGCGNNTMPDVYTNVTMFRNWIGVKLSEWGYKSSAYIL